jgi:FlaA1/EpsC-like NDP-sugar epimerase
LICGKRIAVRVALLTVAAHGDVLVLDMGEPIRIADLASALIRLSGSAIEEVPVVFTGLRPGEKLHEELFYSCENLLPTPHEKVRRTHSTLAPWPNLWQHFQELQKLILSGSDQSIRAKIQDIVPEYSYGPAMPECCLAEKDVTPSITLPLSPSAAASHGGIAMNIPARKESRQRVSVC